MEGRIERPSEELLGKVRELVEVFGYTAVQSALRIESLTDRRTPEEIKHAEDYGDRALLYIQSGYAPAYDPRSLSA